MAAEAVIAGRDPAGRLRVLLVEDELGSGEVLALILAEHGYEVTLAADGKQALERLEAAAPDLLVTDFMMPVMNGADLIRAVREMPRYRELRVLVISGAPPSALRAYGLDFNAFLRMPFGLDEFLGAVRALHGGA